MTFPLVNLKLGLFLNFFILFSKGLTRSIVSFKIDLVLSLALGDLTKFRGLGQLDTILAVNWEVFGSNQTETVAGLCDFSSF